MFHVYFSERVGGCSPPVSDWYNHYSPMKKEYNNYDVIVHWCDDEKRLTSVGACYNGKWFFDDEHCQCK